MLLSCNLLLLHVCLVKQLTQERDYEQEEEIGPGEVEKDENTGKNAENTRPK